MSRRSVALPAALLAGLLALPACDKTNKPTASDTPPPPGGIPTPIPGPGVPAGPGGPNAGQPNDPSLPPKPQPLGLTSDVRTRLTSQNNLKEMAIGFHNAASVYRDRFPVGIADKSGKVGLSWRVAILPYVEQDGLYKQFKLDEPWDSASNKKLIAMMPKIYAPPSGDTRGYTYYRSFSGPDAIMPPTNPGQPGQVVQGVSILGITDGSSNTLLVAEAAEPVIWTKPEELPFDKSKAPPKLGGGVFKDGFNVALCDGSVRFLKITINPTQLGNAINRQDGQIVNLDN